MKDISFLSEKFQFLKVKFSIYLNRRVFVMCKYKHNSDLQVHKFLTVKNKIKIGMPRKATIMEHNPQKKPLRNHAYSNI